MTELYKQKLRQAFEPITTPNNPTGYLLKGDVSGIQEFIFNVASKGAAKSLKARSYYIKTIAELSNEYVIKQLKNKKTPFELFYNGGGNFFIVINTIDDKIYSIIEDIQKQLDEYLQYDEISVILSLSPTYIEDFKISWGRLNKASNTNKLRKSKSLGHVFFSQFPENKYNSSLPKLRELSGIQNNNPNEVWRIICEQFIKHSIFNVVEFNLQNEKENFSKRIVNKLPQWKDYILIKEYSKYRGENYPSEGNENGINTENTIDFDGISDFAANRTGTRKLGILKLDVDNLGKLFGQINNKEEGKKLCNSFQTFFDNRLYDIWEKESFSSYIGDKETKIPFKSNIYTVFAGGDDCFIVGAWDAVIYFAQTLQETFVEYVREDRILKTLGNISFSAGIVIIDPTHPVSDFAEKVEEQLSNSKSKCKFGESKCFKNAITIFGETLSWDDYTEIIRLKEYLTQLIKVKNQSRAIIDVIKNSAKGFENIQNKVSESKKIDMAALWRLKYYIARQFKGDEKKKIETDFFNTYINALTSVLTVDKITNPMIFAIAARLAEFETRKTLEYESQQ